MTGLASRRSASSVAFERAAPSSGETYFFFAPLFLPFVILGVPILDSDQVARDVVDRTLRFS